MSNQLALFRYYITYMRSAAESMTSDQLQQPKESATAKSKTLAVTSPKPRALGLKQATFAKHYIDPMSPLYGNALKSALAAGYEQDYAENITHLKPKWLQDLLARVIPDETDIIYGIRRETTYGLRDGERDSAMSAQTRLKAYELIGRTRRVNAFSDNKASLNMSGPIHITLGSSPDKPSQSSPTVVDSSDYSVQ